ncbi:DEAD/DEAH box helicase OS=Streptomyces fumanus OX=67302 GN=GCM10018772_37300 PE=4 SV=1 [Streptomyces fumanus]
MLDELTAAGEVVWAGAGSLPGKDGWISLYLADAAPLLLPPPHPLETTALHQSVLDALSGGYGLFFRQIADQVRATTHPEVTDPQLADALWDLAWSGLLTNDTLAPLRSFLGSGRTAGSTAHRAKRAAPRGRYGSLTAAARPASRSGPPTVAGRWSLLPARGTDTTVRAHALARTLLDRHGVVTRGAVSAEGVEGGFSAVYRVLSVFEESGQARRGYVVEGLGAAQFAMDGAVDRLRAVANARDRGDGLPGGGLGGPQPPTDGSGGSPDPDWSAPAAPFPALDTDFVTPGATTPGPPYSRDEYVSPRDYASPGTGGPRSGGPRSGGPRSGGPYSGGPYGGGFAPGGHGNGFPGRRTRPSPASRAVVLAAADPANAYGAALPWPEPPTGATQAGPQGGLPGRPGRR